VISTIPENRKLAIDFDAFSENVQIQRPLVTEGLVTINKYNQQTSKFESNLATLDENRLIDFVKFCMQYEGNKKRQNCWTFVKDAVLYLARKENISRDAQDGFLSKINKIIVTNAKKYIKIFKQELRSQNCKEAQIGVYQRYDYEGGIVITINKKKKFAIDIGTLEDVQEAEMKITNNCYSNGCGKIREFDESNSRREKPLSTLRTNELIQFLLYYMERSNSETLDSWSFVSKAVKYLNSKTSLSTIRQAEPEYIKEVKKIMREKKCTTADIGWYETMCDIEGGMMISINGEKLAMEFYTKVELKRYGVSDVCCESALTTLGKMRKNEVIDLMEFCMSYKGNNSAEANCTSFISDSIKYLNNSISKISNEEKLAMFFNKINEIRDKEHEHIKRIKAEMKKESCREIKIGWYQVGNILAHIGLVLIIDGKQILTIDFETRIDEREDAAKGKTTTGLVVLEAYDDSKFIMKQEYATLNKKELIKFIGFCIDYENEHDFNLKTQNCRFFVRDAFQYLKDKGLILRETMTVFSNELDKIRVKDGEKHFIWRFVPKPIKAIFGKKS